MLESFQTDYLHDIKLSKILLVVQFNFGKLQQKEVTPPIICSKGKLVVKAEGFV